MGLIAWMEGARHSPTLRGWVKALRYFLALIFIWPGAEKLSGEFFRRAADEPGILPFFQVLHGDAHLYWRFIGLSQVVAGLFLLFRRTALWGAILCAPIYANIVVILWALPFDTPSRIAGPLFMGCDLFLLLWYAPELASVARASPASEGSLRAGWRGAWRQVWFRWLVAFLVAGWTTLHVLDRMGKI
jgi:hypothetical protein